MSACYYAQFVLNGGRPIAQSIPATEHRRARAPRVRASQPRPADELRRDSVMTSWATERAALEHMIDKFGEGTFACVMDRRARAGVTAARVLGAP